MSKDLIRAVKLHVTYFVYRDGQHYRLESGTRGDSRIQHAGFVSSTAVAAAAEALAENYRTVIKAMEYIERIGPQRHGFRFGYGHKLKYEVQNALIVLVAQGETHVEKRGRGFEFTPTRRLNQRAVD